MSGSGKQTVRCWPVALTALSALLAVAASLGVLLGAGGQGPGAVFPAAAPLRLLFLAAWVGLVAADERALGPLILHEPIVAAPVAGLLLGCWSEALFFGVALQAIWPGLVPLGGVRQPHAGVAAVVGVAWLWMLPGVLLAWTFLAGLAAALLAAAWGEETELWLRRWNEKREAKIYLTSGDALRRNLHAHACAGLAGAEAAGLAVFGAMVLIPLLLLVAAAALGSAPKGPAAAVGGGVPGPGGGLLLVFFALGGVAGRHLPVWRTLLRGQPASGRLRPPGDPATGTPWRRYLTGAKLGALLTLQAGFSNRHLQRSGFLRALLATPVGDMGSAARRERERLIDSLRREGAVHCHPLLSSALVGAIDRVVWAADHDPPPRSPLRLLEIGGSVLAQWGDRALWGGLRPAMALLAIALLPLGALPVVVAYVAAGLLFHGAGRLFLYRWGWVRGWETALGGGTWLWHRFPVWIEAGLTPLALLAAASLLPLLRGGLGFQPPGAVFNSAGIWFILGALAGAGIGRRPLQWSWACLAAGLLSAYWWTCGASCPWR